MSVRSMSLLIPLILFLGTVAGQYHDGFTHRQQLDMNQNFVVFWKPGTDPNTRFIFELHGKTKGWMGIGLSSNGAMTAADIVFMWFDAKGKPQISDRHGPSTARGGLPEVDAHQDYRLISGAKNETHFIFRIERDMDTCDEQDWKITTDTVHILYAKNNNPPKSDNDFEQHDERGSQSIRLLSPDENDQAQKQFNAQGVTYVDFHPGNIKVPEDRDTLYWCKVFPTKKFDKRMQMIGYDMMVEKGHEKFVHHMLIYGCRDPKIVDYLDKPGECYSGNNQFMDFCNDVVGGWAVGGQAFVFPEDKGLKWIAEEYDYVAAEFHYDNSDFVKNITDNSFLRVYVTEKIRPVSVGRFTVAKNSNNVAIVVPPKQEKFTQYSYCYADCTKNLNQSIYIISGLLHSHLAGVAIRFRHIRNGKELPMLLYDQHYDFNYQAPQIRFDNPVEFMPGDEIILECDYNTMNRNKTLIGGLSTHEEMCLGWLDYYPQQEGLTQMCQGTTSNGVFAKALGATEFYRHNDDDATVLLPDGRNISYQKFLDDFDWGQEGGRYVAELQKASKFGEQVQICALGKPGTADEWRINPKEIPMPLVEGDEYCESKLAIVITPMTALSLLIGLLVYD